MSNRRTPFPCLSRTCERMSCWRLELVCLAGRGRARPKVSYACLLRFCDQHQYSSGTLSYMTPTINGDANNRHRKPIFAEEDLYHGAGVRDLRVSCPPPIGTVAKIHGVLLSLTATESCLRVRLVLREKVSNCSESGSECRHLYVHCESTPYRDS